MFLCVMRARGGHRSGCLHTAGLGTAKPHGECVGFRTLEHVFARRGVGRLEVF